MTFTYETEKKLIKIARSLNLNCHFSTGDDGEVNKMTILDGSLSSFEDFVMKARKIVDLQYVRSPYAQDWEEEEEEEEEPRFPRIEGLTSEDLMKVMSITNVALTDNLKIKITSRGFRYIKAKMKGNIHKITARQRRLLVQQCEEFGFELS